MTARRGAWFYTATIGIGLVTGLLSGLFGVGGGTVIVPLLMMSLQFDQRRAAGTSLAAIMPSATVGMIVYGIHGSVDLLAAAILAVGAIGAAQVGTWMLPRVSLVALRWGFIGFLALVVASLFVVIPSRTAELAYTPLSISGLVVLGIVTGLLAGLLGVGGGVLVVPMLILLFGVSDVTAKGTSLLMLIPTTISGTVGNARRNNIDFRAAVVIGLAACTTTALGAWLATIIDPRTGSILFAAFLSVIAVQIVVRGARRPRG